MKKTTCRLFHKQFFLGLALSLLTAFGVCGVSSVQLIPQESSRLPLQSTLVSKLYNQPFESGSFSFCHLYDSEKEQESPCSLIAY
jgi:hypothetical protein